MGCSGGGYSGLNISYGGYSGCFSGNGKVQLKDKTFKKVKDLIKGDTLEDGAIVDCLIKIKVNKIQQVIELNDVYYTLKHPSIFNGKWTNPINIKPPKSLLLATHPYKVTVSFKFFILKLLLFIFILILLFHISFHLLKLHNHKHHHIPFA